MASHEYRPGFAPGHPENDLHAAADYSNKVRPTPHSFDELADQPDPKEVNERNAASTKQALWFAAATVAITFLVAGILAFISRMMGGPLCEAGEATWLCTSTWRTMWAVISSIPPVAGILGCAIIMVRKLNRYERWMPWMGVFWLPIVPFAMWWLTITIGILAADSAY